MGSEAGSPVSLLRFASSARNMKRLFTKKRDKNAVGKTESSPVMAPTPLSTSSATVVPYTSPPQSPETLTEPGLVRPRPTYASPTSSFAAAAPQPTPVVPYPTPPISLHQAHGLSQSQGSATSPVEAPARSSSLLGAAGRTGLPGLSPSRTKSQGARSTVSDVSATENEGKLSVG